jgi:hypothetical protein
MRAAGPTARRRISTLRGRSNTPQAHRAFPDRSRRGQEEPVRAERSRWAGGALKPPDAQHTDAIHQYTDEYEARVASFFDEILR